MSEANHLRHELAAADERESGARNALLDAQRSLAASQAETGRLRAVAAAADERRAVLESDLEKVRAH